MTRITQNMMSRTLLSDLQDVTDRLARTQSKLSSGKDLQQPSDDPYRASRALQFRADLAQNQQYQRNVDEAASWQDATDTALSQIGDLTLRARDLLVQGGSDSIGQQGRQSIAVEIDQLIDGVKSSANAQYAGRYVLGGSLTTTAPYTPGPSDAYAGNTQVLRREIGPGVQIDVNQVGSAVVGDDTTGLLATLRQISADLKAGNGPALQDADLKALDAAHDTLTAARATVGAVGNRLDSAKGRLTQVEDATSKLLSETEDADMAKSLIDFSMQQAVYQSALKSGAQIIQPSLMDFLQ